MDYKQTDIIGHKWHRFSRVVIENPRTSSPFVVCVEQEVLALEGSEIVRDIGNLNFGFDPNATFELINPLTNEPTGQLADGKTVYALVYSYVMSEAAKRDVARVAAEAAAAEAAAAEAAVALAQATEANNA